MAGRRKEIVVTINNEDEFLKYYDENHEKLVGEPHFKLNFNFIPVLDLHPEWSGACDLMNPTYK